MTQNKEYYFSKMTLTLATILMLIMIFIFVLAIVFSFKYPHVATIGGSIAFGLLLIASLPNYSRFLYCLFTNKPALILTKDTLIDNTNRQEYKWSEIKNITQRFNSGRNPSSYTSINLINPEPFINNSSNPFTRLTRRLNTKYFHGTFSIPHNSIKCKSTELHDTLIRYHKENGGHLSIT